VTGEDDLLAMSPVTVLMVGVNGTGKTTTVGKLAKQSTEEGRKVLLGSADTFRAAASEQLDIWADRARVPVVRRDRGADPAAVAFDTVAKAEETGADLTLIDTAGRLHTSTDLMRELQKVKRVTENRSKPPVMTILVMDATTGQNGLNQAREFDAALGLDGLILTKLDGTAKGGIAVAVVRELGIPILRIGVGEGIDDLRPFIADEFARALISGE
jgi:fused signal recognition particle receptor